MCGVVGADLFQQLLPPPPDILSANDQPWQLYSLASTQLILAPSGQVVYFSIPALVSLMDIYKVKDKKDCLDKVVYIWHLMNPVEDKKKG